MKQSTHEVIVDSMGTIGVFQGYYEVESILSHRYNQGELFYLVKWANYSIAEATWEPSSSLDHLPYVIQDYEKTNKEFTKLEVAKKKRANRKSSHSQQQRAQNVRIQLKEHAHMDCKPLSLSPPPENKRVAPSEEVFAKPLPGSAFKPKEEAQKEISIDQNEAKETLVLQEADPPLEKEAESIKIAQLENEKEVSKFLEGKCIKSAVAQQEGYFFVLENLMGCRYSAPSNRIFEFEAEQAVSFWDEMDKNLDEIDELSLF